MASNPVYRGTRRPGLSGPLIDATRPYAVAQLQKDDPRYDSIWRLEDLVNTTWYTSLHPYMCLSREQRKCIRNVVRDYMSGYPQTPVTKLATDVAIQWLARRYQVENTYYVTLMRRDGPLYNLWYNNLTNAYNVSTLGRYILFNTLAIIHAGFYTSTFTFDDVNFSTVSTNEMENMMSTAFSEFIRFNVEINHDNHCPYMFVGLPMYWINTYLDMEQVRDRLTRPFADAGKQYTVMYNAYLDYVDELNDEEGIELSYMGRITAFHKCVPEFMMDALCYTCGDLVTKTDNRLARVYLTHALDGAAVTNKLLYYELSNAFQGSVNIPRELKQKFDFTTDTSAVYIEPYVKSGDVYAPLYKLITSQDCSRRLVGSEFNATFSDSNNLNVRVNAPYVPRPPGPPSEPLPRPVPPGPTLPLDEIPHIPPDNTLDVPLVPSPSDDVDTVFTIFKIDALRSQLATLWFIMSTVVSITNSNNRMYLRLAKHLETMREYSLLLATKLDIQSLPHAQFLERTEYPQKRPFERIVEIDVIKPAPAPTGGAMVMDDERAGVIDDKGTAADNKGMITDDKRTIVHPTSRKSRTPPEILPYVE
uniref:P4c n=1 Tax=Rousettus bat poxvirus TaxID=3141933 RepID=A0AAU7E298_9POXV